MLTEAATHDFLNWRSGISIACFFASGSRKPVSHLSVRRAQRESTCRQCQRNLKPAQTGLGQHQITTIHSRQVVGDGEPQPRTGNLLVRANPSSEHDIAFRLVDALAIIIDRHPELAGLGGHPYFDS